jgi:RNA polymerase sigma factor (sigma-70 family)
MLLGPGGMRSAEVEPLKPRSTSAAEIVALDTVLRALEAKDPRKSQVVELRFFGGLTVDETAEALGVSVATVMRDWKLARTWLLRELRRDERGR